MDYLQKIIDAKRMVKDGRPKDACGILRPVLEKHLAELCAQKNTHPASDSIYDMIKALEDKRAIDNVQRSRFMHFKNLGNAGSHAGSEHIFVSDANYFINGLSVSLNIPDNIEPEPIIEDQHISPHNHSYDDDQRRKALISAYYLSEFEHEKLKLGNQSKTFIDIANALNVKESTLRNYRDYFDPITSSTRRGWWQKETPPQFRAIFREFKGAEEEKLRKLILGFIEQ